MVHASGNSDAQEKMHFSILKSATIVTGEQLDSHGLMQIPGRVDSSFNALTRIADQGEKIRVLPLASGST